jgi:hypothetical protein
LEGDQDAGDTERRENETHVHAVAPLHATDQTND